MKTEKKALAKTIGGAATSSKLADPDTEGPPPEADDPWKAVDDADLDRDLSGDEDDDSTSIFSMCTKVDATEEDQDVKAFRKFFFGYLSELLALMRTVESMEYATGLKQGGTKKSE